MNAQPSLPGFDPAPRREDRLFLAVFPDAETAARIEQLAQALKARHGLKGKLLEAHRLHITLHHLGDHAGLPPDLVRQAREAAASAAAAASSFEVTFDRAMSFEQRVNRPFVLRGGAGLGALVAFQQSLGLALAKSGAGRWVDARFTPHVTLLYDDRGVAEEAVEPMRWTAREIVLVHSLIGKHVHLPLGRWPLGA